MNLLTAFLLLVVGLVLLWKSADLLVSGAVGLSQRLGISSFVIGLTVVAMGTSAPEAAASIAAALRGTGSIAIGNVFGSNIANLALVGGVCALIAPVLISKTVLKREMPAMVVVAILLWPILQNLQLSRFEGIGLLIIFAGMIFYTVYDARKQTNHESNLQQYCKSPNTKRCIIYAVIGLIGLALGADITVRGAVFIGQWVGLSEAVIRLTIIALGTSLPELVTCVVAATKGHNDISIGNLVGSNIFNTLLVTGVAGTICPFSIVPRLIGFDYLMMISVSIGFVLLSVLGKKKIGRLGGIILLGTYVGYIAFLLIVKN
ncbi:MAG: calcium/sodium antiporter [Planctomycetota bacterium]|jgi:cation:H+ antiporter